MKKILSELETKQVIEMYRSGMTCHQTSVYCKLPRDVVDLTLRRAGVMRSAGVTAREKQCKKCNLSFLSTTSNHKYCDDCRGENGSLRKILRYDINASEYETLLLKQEGHCALCPEEVSDVDHCHVTNRVRGLLCRKCNLTIALLENRSDWVERAREYLSGTSSS